MHSYIKQQNQRYPLFFYCMYLSSSSETTLPTMQLLSNCTRPDYVFIFQTSVFSRIEDIVQRKEKNHKLIINIILYSFEWLESETFWFFSTFKMIENWDVNTETGGKNYFFILNFTRQSRKTQTAFVAWVSTVSVIRFSKCLPLRNKRIRRLQCRSTSWRKDSVTVWECSMFTTVG